MSERNPIRDGRQIYQSNMELILTKRMDVINKNIKYMQDNLSEEALHNSIADCEKKYPIDPEGTTKCIFGVNMEKNQFQLQKRLREQ